MARATVDRDLGQGADHRDGAGEPGPGVIGGSRANWPGWGTRSRRLRCGRSCTRLASMALRRSGTAWPQFLAARAHAIITSDFLAVETVLFRRLYVLVFIEHGTRRLRVAG